MKLPRTIAPHLAIAGLVLVGLALWVHAAGQVSIDEGVAVVQARAVADGSWTVADPLARVDSDGAAFPLRSSARTEDGYLPYAKHPAYPALLSLADRVGGVSGMVALSIVGALGAAATAAALARRFDDRLAVPTVYVVALGSPLLFDSTLVIAHTLGAALAGLAAVAVVRHGEAARRSGWWLLLAVAAVAGTVLLRGEGALLGGSAALVLAGLAWRSRSRSTGLAALAAGGGTVLGFGIDRAWSRALMGGGLQLQTVGGEAVSWFQARLDGFGTTMLQASYGADRAAPLLVGGVVLLGVVVAGLRFPETAGRLVRPAAVAAAVAVLVWSATASASPVPGLVMAFPLLWVGLLLGRWTDQPVAVALVLVALVFAGAVFATQYRQGGGYEWGARYLALAVPLGVPVALLGLVRVADAARDRGVVPWVGAALVVVSVGLSWVAVSAKRDAGTAAERLGRGILAAAPASHLGADDADGRPVVVSLEFSVPQAITGVYDDARWLQLYDLDGQGGARAGARVRRLVADGVDRFSVVTLDPARHADLFEGTREVARRRVGLWSVLVLEPTGTP